MENNGSMNTDVLTSLISASAAVLTAMVALVLNSRAFTGLKTASPPWIAVPTPDS